MKIKRFVCNAFQENCYVVSDGNRCVIIDPGFANAKPGAFPAEPFLGEDGNDAGGAGELDALYRYLDAEGLQPEAILLTHSHWDHTLGVAALVERFGIPVKAAQAKTGAFPAEPFFGEDGNDAGGALYGFAVIETPGHTPDSVCYYNESEHVLFTGDTLFAGSIGRTDLPGGDYDAEIRSIMEKLIFLPGETDIYPGHGPSSTIARERMSNPFLEPFNEREELD
jgi:glyoxylase-like metal-dependent hydrolase (beta-lactamase superfamily II)